MEHDTFMKLVKQLKPDKPFMVTYKTDIGSTAPFRKTSGGCSLCKTTSVTTVTGLNYGELEDVKQKKAEQAAAIEAGTAKASEKEYVSPDETIIPGTMSKSKKTGEEYLLVYPSTHWKTHYKNFNIVNPDGTFEATYEDINDIKEFMTPGAYDKATAKFSGGSLNPIQKIKVSNIFDIIP